MLLLCCAAWVALSMRQMMKAASPGCVVDETPENLGLLSCVVPLFGAGSRNSCRGELLLLGTNVL